MTRIFYLSIFLMLAAQGFSQNIITVCGGNQACLTLPGVRGDIEWQRSFDQLSWTIMSNSNTDTFCFSLNQDAWFRAEIREGSCAPIYSDVMEVRMRQSPVAHGGPGLGLCLGNSGSLGDTVAATGGTPPYTYAWSPAFGLSSTTVSNPVTTTNQSLNYYLTVTDSSGCQGYDTVSVVVSPSPVAHAGQDTAIPCSLNVVLGGNPTATGGIPPYTYQWSPNYYLSSTTVANPLADPNVTTVYTVVVTDSTGCTDSASVTITVFGSGGGAGGNQIFSYTGSPQPFVVPNCIDTVTIEAWGAQGANAIDRLTTNSTGGLGGYATGKLAVTAGDTLWVYVGQQGQTSGNGGYNGGGNGGYGNPGGSCVGGNAGGGGGASDVRAGGTALTDRVIVAGGGGGAGRDYCNGSCQPCGCGGGGGGAGGVTGTAGQAAYNCGFSYPGSGINYGDGANQLSGGTGGPGDNGGNSGINGTQGIGGDGAAGTYDVAGGGGGGGYYGGGGGGGASSGSGVGGGGGGGGSSFLGSLNQSSTLTGVRQGNGEVIISW